MQKKLIFVLISIFLGCFFIIPVHASASSMTLNYAPTSEVHSAFVLNLKLTYANRSGSTQVINNNCYVWSKRTDAGYVQNHPELVPLSQSTAALSNGSSTRMRSTEISTTTYRLALDTPMTVANGKNLTFNMQFNFYTSGVYSLTYNIHFYMYCIENGVTISTREYSYDVAKTNNLAVQAAPAEVTYSQTPTPTPTVRPTVIPTTTAIPTVKATVTSTPTINITPTVTNQVEVTASPTEEAQNQGNTVTETTDISEDSSKSSNSETNPIWLTISYICCGLIILLILILFILLLIPAYRNKIKGYTQEVANKLKRNKDKK